MQSLLYFLLWAGLFLVLMRFGCGAHVMGHRRGHGGHHPGQDRTAFGQHASQEEMDPVCGMTVKTASAKSSLYSGLAYYFCSTTCRDKFEGVARNLCKGARLIAERRGASSCQLRPRLPRPR